LGNAAGGGAVFIPDLLPVDTKRPFIVANRFPLGSGSCILEETALPRSTENSEEPNKFGLGD